MQLAGFALADCLQLGGEHVWSGGPAVGPAGPYADDVDEGLGVYGCVAELDGEEEVAGGVSGDGDVKVVSMCF